MSKNNIFAPVTDGLVQLAHAANPPKPEDYLGEDGYTYCGVCHKARTCYNYLHPGEAPLPCNCDCVRAELRERDRQIKLRQLEARLEKAFDYKELCSTTFAQDDNSNPRLTSIAKKYCENFKKYRKMGAGLLLSGRKKGTGKTFMATCIAHELCEREFSVKMTTVARYLLDIARYGYKEYFEKLVAVDCLILDDLDAHRKTDWVNDHLFNLIDARYSTKKPVIITTNMPIEQLKQSANEMEERIRDRLIGMCGMVGVDGESHRVDEAIVIHKMMQEDLGL